MFIIYLCKLLIEFFYIFFIYLNWSNWGRRRVRNVWWLIFYCLAAQILKVIVGFWRRQSLIPSEQIVPVWGKNGGYVKNYQLSRVGLINLGRYPSKLTCTNKRKICKNRAKNNNPLLLWMLWWLSQKEVWDLHLFLW